MKINKFVVFLSFVILVCTIFCFTVSADDYEYTAPTYSPEYLPTILGYGFESKTIEGFYSYMSYDSNFNSWCYFSNDYRENDILLMCFRAVNYDVNVPYDYYVYFPSEVIERLVFDSYGGDIPLGTYFDNQESFNRFYNYFYSTFIGSYSSPVNLKVFESYFDGDINNLSYNLHDYIEYNISRNTFDTFLMSYYHEFASQWDSFYEYSEYSYNNGYDSGFSQGFSDGTQQGYITGYNDSMRDQNAFKDGIATIFNAPFYLVRQIFSFELFGINIASIIFGILTIVLLAFVIKLFL